jgi:lipopolysaccharide transport system ATP-binding protein
MSSDPQRTLQPGPPAVEVEGVRKSYRQYRSAGDRLIEELSFGRIRRHREKHVLDDVSFSAARGECIGILGRNGCGKSTLLGIIAGTITPTAGLVRRRGRISALLELGTAFYPEASGRENIFQYATAQQISRSEIAARLPSIIEYAELGADIDYPLRNYSSGMVARLAFAVACSVEPDLLIVDETLAVGDIAFRHKALSTIQRVRDAGATILFVTHNPAQVIGLADRSFVLEKGKIIAEGRPADVVPVYQRMMLSGRAEAAPVVTGAAADATDIETDLSAGGMRYGTGAGRLLGVSLCVAGHRVQSLEQGGDVVVRISWRAELPIEHPNVGFLW